LAPPNFPLIILFILHPLKLFFSTSSNCFIWLSSASDVIQILCYIVFFFSQFFFFLTLTKKQQKNKTTNQLSWPTHTAPSSFFSCFHYQRSVHKCSTQKKLFQIRVCTFTYENEKKRLYHSLLL
jgi:hypothetical protein